MNPALKLLMDIFSMLAWSVICVVATIIAVILHIMRKESMRWRS